MYPTGGIANFPCSFDGTAQNCDRIYTSCFSIFTHCFIVWPNCILSYPGSESIKDMQRRCTVAATRLRERSMGRRTRTGWTHRMMTISLMMQRPRKYTSILDDIQTRFFFFLVQLGWWWFCTILLHLLSFLHLFSPNHTCFFFFSLVQLGC